MALGPSSDHCSLCKRWVALCALDLLAGITALNLGRVLPLGQARRCPTPTPTQPLLPHSNKHGSAVRETGHREPGPGLQRGSESGRALTLRKTNETL